MEGTGLRKNIRDLIGDKFPSNLGLRLNRYNKELKSDSDRTKECEKINEDSLSLYKTAYDRWNGFLESNKPWCESKILKTDNRLFIGVGSASVMEFGINLQHAYGMPYIPGSSIKGVCNLYAHKFLGEKQGDRDWLRGGVYHRTFFGNNDDKNKTDSAGIIDFMNAWWAPGSTSPFVPEIINCHHQTYYSGKGDPPADWDQPIPVQIMAVTGKFLFSVRGPCGWNRNAMDILTGALRAIGVGGKTNAGYGRFDVLESSKNNRSVPLSAIDKFKKKIPDDRHKLPGIMGELWSEISKETNKKNKIKMAGILKDAFNAKQFKRSCKNKKKWALGILDLLNTKE